MGSSSGSLTSSRSRCSPPYTLLGALPAACTCTLVECRSSACHCSRFPLIIGVEARRLRRDGQLGALPAAFTCASVGILFSCGGRSKVMTPFTNPILCSWRSVTMQATYAASALLHSCAAHWIHSGRL